MGEIEFPIDQNSLLHVACLSGHADVIDYLLGRESYKTPSEFQVYCEEHLRLPFFSLSS